MQLFPECPPGDRAKGIDSHALTKTTGPAAMSLNNAPWQGGRGAIKED